MPSPSQARLLRSILEAIGAGAACTLSILAPACGGQVGIPAPGSSSGGGDGATSSSSAGGSDAGPLDCKAALRSSTQDLPPGTCGADAGAYGQNLNCFAAPAAPATCAGAFTEACLLSTYSCGLSSGGQSIACGPFEGASGACCYVIQGDCAVGRPFTVDGSARLGALVQGHAWGEPLAPEVAALDPQTRAALAEAWGREALFEHASIASFARFTLELLALGAPSDLVAAAQQALCDEHGHARVCFGLAGAYAGAAKQPGPLEITGALRDASDPVAVAASLAREGCIAETVAALQVARAADEARDPVVKAALSRIAEEEAEHAALAWRALAWMLDTGGPAARAAVVQVFAAPDGHVSLGAVTERPGNEAAMRAHGYSPVEERRALAREALGKVVGPAAVALLARRESPPAGLREASAHVRRGAPSARST